MCTCCVFECFVCIFVKHLWTCQPFMVQIKYLQVVFHSTAGNTLSSQICLSSQASLFSDCVWVPLVLWHLSGFSQLRNRCGLNRVEIQIYGNKVKIFLFYLFYFFDICVLLHSISLFFKEAQVQLNSSTYSSLDLGKHLKSP